MKKEIMMLAVALMMVTANCSKQQMDTFKINPQTDPPKNVPKTINTNIDPAYIYSYVGTKYVPPQGSVLLITGQDKNAIPEYINAVGIVSGGFASYCAVTTNAGLTNDQVKGTEIQNARWIAQTYPNTVLQTAMWMSGDWDRIVIINTTNHTYDANIDAFIALALSVNRPVFLRIGYEFDGPHNKLQPQDYKTAYKYIVDRIRAAGVNNVAFVWHSWADAPYNGYAVSDWYPGDAYVDWFGISFFKQILSPSTRTHMDAFVDLARTYKKPVMIAESTPIGGITPNSYQTWNDWFVPLFDYIHNKNIKAVSYINCNWDILTETIGWGWGDTRVQQFPLIQERWTNEINKPRYLKQSSGLFSTLGY